jgi:multiphosphoryl transfer protein
MTLIHVLAPMTGRVVPMEEVPDPVFAEKMLGDGLAIKPSEGLAVAPLAGTLVVFHSAGHAFVIDGPDGVRVAVHLGLDTVRLAGAPFERLAEVGDEVIAGQPIVRVDLAAIAAAGLDDVSPVFTEGLDESWSMAKTGSPAVRAGQDVLFTLERRAGAAEREAGGGATEPGERVAAHAPDTAVAAGSEASAELEIRNATGVHIRVAAPFSREVARFESRVTVQNLSSGGPPVDARSPTLLVGAELVQGTRIRLAATGEDAAQAVAALSDYVETRLFDRTPETAPGAAPGGTAQAAGAGAVGGPADLAAPAADETFGLDYLESVRRGATGLTASHVAGTPAAAGVAIGPAWRYPSRQASLAEPPGAPDQAPPTPAAPEMTASDALAAIKAAADAASDQLLALADRLAGAGRPDDAAIFDAQAAIAVDPALLDEAVRKTSQGASPVEAVAQAATEAAEKLAALEDELLAARAADVRDVGARIGRILRGELIELPERPSIAVAEDLPPSITAEIPPGFLLGVALAGGSKTAHAVILARGHGIPAVVGAAGLVERLDGAIDAAVAAGWPSPPFVALDGESGEVTLNPSPEDVQSLRRRGTELAARRRRSAALRDRPAATADGERVTLLANIGAPDEAVRALEACAEGVGLFRTEFLYMKRQTPPTEREQTDAYCRAMSAFGPDRPVVIRLADIGGDKGIPYLGLPAEANPFLGVRAIRLAYRSHDLLRTQLRAIWQAGALAGVTPHIMAPMVATLGDVKLLAELRDEARDDVLAANLPCAEKMVTGIMVEIPSAAILAAELGRVVDFFSIGTNDLTQYLMAADRGNASLSSLQDALHPAVLRTIGGVVRGADSSGIPVAVCGELAGDPAGALVLVGLGVDELSADAGSLDGIRAALAAVTRPELDDLAARALASVDAESVRALAAPFLARLEG